MARLYISPNVWRGCVMPNPEEFLDLESNGNWVRLLSGTDHARPIQSPNGLVRLYSTIAEALQESEDPHLVWLSAAQQYKDIKEAILLTKHAYLYTRQNGAWKRDYALENARDILENTY